jgi:hypothetical protein
MFIRLLDNSSRLLGRGARSHHYLLQKLSAPIFFAHG